MFKSYDDDGVIIELEEKGIQQNTKSRERLPGWPQSLEPVTSECDIEYGHHIVFKFTKPPFRAKFQSAIVAHVEEHCHIEIIMNSACANGVVKKSISIRDLLELSVHKITYTVQLYDSSEAVKRAESRLNEKCYHVLKNNSHFFVTWCITGREQSLADILRALEDDQQNQSQNIEMEQEVAAEEERLKPIFYQISDTSRLRPIDHLYDGSQHYLVESVSQCNNKFSAYILGKENNKVNLVHNIPVSSSMLRIEIEGDLNKMSSEKRVIKAAEEQISNEWISPEYFVTTMKHGTGFSFDNSQCFVLKKPVNIEFTFVTPKIKITESDHLMIRDYRTPNHLHSVIVYSCPDHTRVSVKPQVDSADVLDLTLWPEVYRVEYSASIPCSETLLRGESEQGDLILRNNPIDHSCFVNWAKTGQIKSITLPEDVMNSRCYEKVTCSSQIEVGDHLIQLEHPDEHIHVHNPRHLLVTECVDESKLKVIYCKLSCICERIEELEGELYIIRCRIDQEPSRKDTIERARKQVGRKYNPWDRMLFITKAKSNQAMEASISDSKDISFAQQPCTSRTLPSSRSRIMCFKQISPGDYIIKEPNTKKLSTIDSSHHYLVVTTNGSPSHCKAIESYSGRIVESHCIIEANTENADSVYYRINYEPGSCIPSEQSIKASQEMLGKQSHIASDRFVQYMKTKSIVQVTLSELPDERDHIQQLKLCSRYQIPFLGSPIDCVRISTVDEQFPVGTHILYKLGNTFPPSYRSALVIGVLKDQSDELVLEFITNTEKDGIIKQAAKYKSLQNLSEVVYLSAPIPKEEAIATAITHLQYHEKFYHPKFYNSHHFVTICVTGREHSLADILAKKQGEEYEENQDRNLKPVIFKVEVNSLDDINPADHVMINEQHYLVKSKDIDNDSFSAYTVVKPLSQGTINVHTTKWKKCIRIEYSLHGSKLCEPLQALERAERELTNGNKWKSSEGFVTKIKCGSEYYFDDRCLMSDNVKILSCTKITPHTSVSKGDHLVLLKQSTPTQYQSVLACNSCAIDSKQNEMTIDIMPPLSLTCTSTSLTVEHEEVCINLKDYAVYRINYSQCLPPEYVLERARSIFGKDILVECNLNPDEFITWAKTGKKLNIPKEFLQKLTEEPNLKLADICPLRYEKIMSPKEIQIGDHLFTKTLMKNSHFMVTVRVTGIVNHVFKAIYLSNGVLKETEHEFNPLIKEVNSQVYRVVYPEAFPHQLAIKRLRSQFKKQHLTTCAASLMRWAKTGSQEGLEISFLINSSAPTSKSQMACFTQLNPGDYFVKESGISSLLNHHYLVISVESPTKCKVIESWRRKVEETEITCKNWPNESTYYRINYDPGQCIQAEQSIEIARDASTKKTFFSRHWKPNSECARESFVHFVKTGEQLLNVENLQDDRLFLQRELVKSAFDLRIGDHIERPLAIAPSSNVQHHMLVVKPISHNACLVIHYKVEKSVLSTHKGDVVCEEVDIFEHGNVFRIVYPERTDPRDGIEKLASKLCLKGRARLQSEIERLTKEFYQFGIGDKASLQNEIEYHLKNNNCEHLIMFATIGIPVSIQVNNIVHHALVCARKSLRVFRGSFFHHGAKCASNEAMGQACSHAGRMAIHVSALAMTGGIEFAISLVVELPVLLYNIYKLNKKAKFRVISEEEFKRRVLKEILIGLGVVAGGTAGTVAGQATIPVPVLGAVVGGILGGLIGQGSGTLAGTLLGRLIKEKKLTLPKTLTYSYKSLLEY